MEFLGVIIFYVIIFAVIISKAKKKGGNRPSQPNVPGGGNRPANSTTVSSTITKTVRQLEEEFNSQMRGFNESMESVQNHYQGAQQQRPVQQQRPAQQLSTQQKAAQAPKYVNAPAKPKTDIVTKAKENAAKQKEDTTLLELEASHGHSHEEPAKPQVHSEVCQTQDPKHKAKMRKEIDTIVPEESLLGSVDDLMIKGYSGNLNFDRDFVGEALDMISNFTINGAHSA